MAATSERVFILAQDVEAWTYWLACLAADDGERLWTIPVEFDLDPQTMKAGMRGKGDGVVIAVYGWGSTVREGDCTVAVSGASEQSLLGEREIVVSSVSVVEPAANGRVWLAGRYNDGTEDTWVTSVGLR